MLVVPVLRSFGLQIRSVCFIRQLQDLFDVSIERGSPFLSEGVFCQGFHACGVERTVRSFRV